LATDIIFKKRLEAENIVQASFVVSEKTAKLSKSYSDGEFVKECLKTVVDILCPNNSNDMHTISLSCPTVIRHIDEPAAAIEQSFKI
jgi:hypothetical protein